MSDVNIYEMIRETEARHPDQAVHEIARRVVAKLRAAERDDLLADRLAFEVGAMRRARVRNLEQAAMEAAAIADWPLRQAEMERQREERQAELRASPWLARPNSRIYKEWTETGAGREWHARHVAERTEKQERQHLWETDHDAYEAKYGAMTLLRRAMDEFAQSVRIEFTTELLGASFALGDGRQVTWGEATLDDHRVRVEMLSRQAAGTIETITLHERAADILRRSGARSLNEAQVLA